VEGLGVALAVKRAEAADLRVLLMDGDEVPDIHVNSQDIVVRGKADTYNGGDFAVSGETGAGVDELLERIGMILKGRAQCAGVAMRLRHKVAMTETVTRIKAVQGMIEDNIGLDLIADELRAAIRAVDIIVGRVDVEDLLDEIFASFCIGK
jgi:tRNA modification GTPase